MGQRAPDRAQAPLGQAIDALSLNDVEQLQEWPARALLSDFILRAPISHPRGERDVQ